ncbi:hypothetical protein SAMN03159353_102621 [Cedecea sp. NFIX57]|nr:hypothetical protein SAMN03159353_102621 [Cedecea sp. NFIX57]
MNLFYLASLLVIPFGIYVKNWLCTDIQDKLKVIKT